MDIESEVLKDFETALDSIDFENYNPMSNEFLTALLTGQMWIVLRKLNKLNYGTESTKTMEMDSYTPIEDEIAGAKHYIQMYIDTKDAMYHQMANDELKHGLVLIKKVSADSGAVGKEKLKQYEMEIQSLQGSL